MDYAEFRRHLGKTGLSVNTFAALIDVRPAAVSNYSRKTRVPTSYAVMAVLMGDSADRGVDCASLLARYGIRPTRLSDGNLAHIESYRGRKSRQDKM